MKNSSNRSVAAQTNANASAAKQQSSTRRIVETRDLWEKIFSHTVSLVVAQIRGQHVDDPRKGFGFGKTDVQPHSRAYAQSLLTGFTTSKAGKVFANDDDLANKTNRVKIAIAILLSTKLAKGGDEGAERIMAKSEPKREKVFAQAVLAALAKPVDEPKADEKADEKATTPKGGKANGKSKTTPKGGKANGKSKSAKK